MKRKVMIYLAAGALFLSAFGGGAAFLTTAPNSTELEPSAKIRQDHTGKAPIAIAGNSWGGLVDGDDDEKKDDEDPGTEGNSWGG